MARLQRFWLHSDPEDGWKRQPQEFGCPPIDIRNANSLWVKLDIEPIAVIGRWGRLRNTSASTCIVSQLGIDAHSQCRIFQCAHGNLQGRWWCEGVLLERGSGIMINHINEQKRLRYYVMGLLSPTSASFEGAFAPTYEGACQCLELAKPQSPGSFLFLACFF